MKINPSQLNLFLDEEDDNKQDKLASKLAKEKIESKRRKTAAQERRRDKDRQEKK